MPFFISKDLLKAFLLALVTAFVMVGWALAFSGPDTAPPDGTDLMDELSVQEKEELLDSLTAPNNK